LAVKSGLTGGVALFFPPFAGGFEFAVASGQDVLVTPLEFVLGRDIADSRVQADGVVVLDKFADDAASLFQSQRRAGRIPK